MFQDLDSTIQAILDDATAPAQLLAADVSFETPEKGYAPAQPTVNLFLFDVHENRTVRDPVPIKAMNGNTFERRRPPLRVDCSYLVTAWSNDVGAVKVAEEHLLLGQALIWLSRFPTIPASYLQGALAAQSFPPPSLVAQLEGQNVNEFWSALGSSPRPAFTLIVTIAMELNVAIPDGPPVVTKEMRLERTDVSAPQQIWFQIAGTIREAVTTNPVPHATVTLVELDKSVQADGEGRFTFGEVNGGNFTLRAAAAGFTTLDTAVAVPGAALNAYDVDLSP
jgi:hypothetical protein